MKVQLALAATPILYHLIDMKHAVTALKKDRLRLAPMEVNNFESTLGDGAFFLSLARTKTSDYFIKNTFGNKVVFVLDGTKLAHNYKLRAVDYWHNNEWNTDDEAEDRLFASKPQIPLLRYLKEVHFATREGWSGGNTLDIITTCKRAKIPCFQYENPDILIKLDKRKAIPTRAQKEVVKLGSGPTQYESPAYTLQALWQAIMADPVKHPVLENGKPSKYATMLNGAKSSKQRQARRNMLDMMKYGMSVTDFNNTLNNRRTELAEKFANKINAYMRKNKLSAEQLIEQLRSKWK